MCDELVDERWRVCVGHGVLGDSDIAMAVRA